MATRPLHYLVCLVLCMVFAPSWAATLFGVVTERTAPTAIEAAHRHLAAHRGDRILLRTPAQIMAANDKQLAQWIGQADSIVAVAVFGDPARRLKDALERHAGPRARVLAMNGEASLNLMSRHLDAEQPGHLSDFPAELLAELARENPSAAALNAAGSHPTARRWLAARQVWQAWGSENMAALFAHLLDPRKTLAAPKPEPSIRLRVGGKEASDAAAWGSGSTLGLATKQSVVVLDLANMDAATPASLCRHIEQRGLQCVQVLTRWGSTSRDALERLPQLIAPAKPAALIVLQDFVVGAAEGREAVIEAFKKLDVPVFKAIRLTDRNATQWRLSPDGLAADTVQYRVALPELQGIGQPVVVSALGRSQFDPVTGIETRPPVALDPEIGLLSARVHRWLTLRSKENRDKRIAIIYYNHPPGRQNIGADNLDVPASLFDMLHTLKAAGYTTGELPATPEALLDRIMAHGVNLPEDKAALRELGASVAGVEAGAYAGWFAKLPRRVQAEMTVGPLGRLHAEVLEAEAANERATGRKRVDAVLKDLRHLVEGIDHPKRQDAMRDLEMLEAGYLGCLDDNPQRRCATLATTVRRLTGYGIEGIKGWGAPPGKIMVDSGKLLVPGLVFGNIFIGPQPPRGWEVDEELLHANTSVTPPHQYLAFYHWLRDRFKADALVHVGRHSTYEFLPGKAVGLTADDYPSLIASDLPGVYPYIVDGVGEGTQAKRRGLAVMVDHLTPPLASTPLYDQLLALRQVVESFEAASSESLKLQAARTMREQVVALNLKAELEASMADVLAVRGIGFEAADDDLLAHEIGHYLTKLQEKFMPYGLHIFGRQWSQASLNLMLDSMKKGGIDDPAVSRKLADSPRLEMLGLLAGLDGRYIAPGKGNDPLRSPEALPTGRNFHAVDGDILPTRVGYRLGETLAGKAASRGPSAQGSEGVILWASDAVRDEGVMVAFSLALMGAEPVWNARGIVTDVRLKQGAARRDVIVTTSGLFRDLYPNLIHLIDRAGRLALAASAAGLIEQRPELKDALAAALAPVPTAAWGHESLEENRVAREWLKRFAALEHTGQSAPEAGRAAALRIFGDAPGAYGTGVNRLTERSGAWRERNEIGRAYVRRMGHGYSLIDNGTASHAAFDTALVGIARTYHGRASNLYGLLDNNDAFDYLGGLSLAVEGRTGKPPEAMILQHAEPGRADVEPLSTALLGELRGRFLNPAWLKPLMSHGYAGARTMGTAFLENLWGWQVTRPDLIQNWAWDEVKAVYFDDAKKIGLPQFLGQGQNAHVKAHMLSIFMVAAEKGFWKADPATIKQMGSELARLVASNGLPGSGHTAPDHPMWQWLAPQLDAADAKALGVTLANARGENSVAAGSLITPPAPATSSAASSRSAPKNIAAGAAAESSAPASSEAPVSQQTPRYYELIEQEAPASSPAVRIVNLLGVLIACVGLFAFGLWRGRQSYST
ncbi:cobaltochelatase subunit CobN [Noviherbaspirillum sp. CPCC 100848]|uniref:Cobaltochelatase subunit CobN n=1 Tax=Noviherbaspirillum album TaxID=3080276 RepID=A0ABU6JAX5_9BURK|nr:cobaltochelatase subunit CobN [Noviherbaspirillum sp. CPCC 100848]MEC4720788.1 cobaltochelatase subunit CobN [Noviherbaspirillum sp. CPCC 100848]